MMREELALKLIQEELGDRPATPENVVEASIAATRKSIYMDYYYAKPEVVEALLLLLKNFMQAIFDEVDALEDDSEESELRIMHQVLRVSLAMRKTINQLYSV